MTETSYTLELCLQQPLMRVDEWYQRGLVSREIVDEYCAIWNQGPHLSTAQLRDGAIRLTHRRDANDDPVASATAVVEEARRVDPETGEVLS